jgi:hypothetical protein
MQMAVGPAIFEAMRVLPPAAVGRDRVESSQPQLENRARPERWVAPNATGRGRLIDLVV